MLRGSRVISALVLGAVGVVGANRADVVAQEPTDRPVTTRQRLDGATALNLPIDSVSQGLILYPGVEQSDAGELMLRGGMTQGHGVYLDGVPVSPANRTSGFLFNLGTSLREVRLDPALSVGTNAFREVEATTGAYESVYGNAASGIVTIDTRAPDGRVTGDLRYSTDGPAGASHRVGINRIMGDIGGAISSRVRFFVALVVDGRQSADNGPGTIDVPVFAAAGTDTVVAVPSAIGYPIADTSYIPVNRYSVFRGRCNAFNGSQNTEIAANYGFDCAGIGLPASAKSGYQLLGKFDVDVVRSGTLSLSAVATQDQTRLFDYSNLTNGQQLQGHRATSAAFTIGYRQHLGETDGGVDLFGALSFQRDRSDRGSLTGASESKTRYPTGGFMIEPFDFQFGRDEFPIDDQLVSNYRNNTPQSRRTPYDIENSDQYGLTSQFRSNPSATDGMLRFIGGGGPVGWLGQFQESRTVAVLSAAWAADRHNTLTLGGEYTRYSITNYSHQLTSQAFSDVYVQSPRRLALYLQDRIEADRFTVVGGVRIDAFASEAQRPFLLDTTSTSTTFGEYVYFPRTASYQGTAPDGRPLTIFVKDKNRTAITPHLQMGYSLTPRTDLWASAGQQVQMPDLHMAYTGVNTDLSITNTDQVFGSDLDFNRVGIAEVGIRHAFSTAVTLEASAYFKDHSTETQVRRESLFDPLLKRQIDLSLIRTDGGRTVKGFDLRVDTRFGRVFTGSVGYAYANAETATGLTPSDTRAHSISGALSLFLPTDWQAGTTLGAMGRNVGLYTTFRFASGSPYTRCPAELGNEFLLSGDLCLRSFDGEFNGARIPGVKQLDLRLAKGFPINSTMLNVFMDVRNLFGFDNTHTLYAVTGTTESAAALAEVQQVEQDSYAQEAWQNGALSFDGGILLPPNTEACANWVNQGLVPSAPSCVYFIHAEQRYGDGDGTFDVDEQEAAITGFYNALRASPNFRDPPRRIRLGVELKF